MFCTNCGKSLPEGAKFCSVCGTPTENADSAPYRYVPPKKEEPEKDTSYRYVPPKKTQKEDTSYRYVPPKKEEPKEDTSYRYVPPKKEEPKEDTSYRYVPPKKEEPNENTSYRYEPPKEPTAEEPDVYAPPAGSERPWEDTKKTKHNGQKLKKGAKKFLLCSAVIIAFSLFVILSAESQANAALPGVPAELRSHFLFENARDYGPCKKLRGDVEVVLYFVDEYNNSWTDIERFSYAEEVKNQLAKLEKSAQTWGVSLNFNLTSKESLLATLLGDTYEERTKKLAAREQQSPIDAYDTYPVAVICAYKKNARSYASRAQNMEYIVIYNDIPAVTHELLHLYGAQDYYVHDGVKSSAKLWLGDSTMLDSEPDSPIDDLTAYLIGWTDELTSNALNFLQATSSITQEELDAADAADSITGYGTRTFEDGSTYTGNMVEGAPEGYGKWTYPDGSYHEGEFTYLKLNGHGIYVWADGSRYEGEFKDSQLHGTGTLYRSDGDQYTGEFNMGVKDGRGTYRWASGDVYEGDFLDGKQTGTGTYYWPDGGVYTGEWKNGQFHGTGTMTYSNGTVRSGRWENGQYLGK